MKLSWFSPLPSDTNDPQLPESMAPYFQHLLPALSRRVDLTIFTKQQYWCNWIDDFVTVKPIAASDSFWSEIHKGDLSIYHLADWPRAFAEFFDLSRTQPGLVVLHDNSIHSLVAFIWAKFRNQPETYLEILRRYAGEESVEIGRQWLENDLPTDQTPKSIPLFNYLLESALAIVTHTPSLMPQLMGSAVLPTELIPLPYQAETAIDSDPIEGPARALVLLSGAKLSLFPVLETLILHPIHPHLELSIYLPEGQRSNILGALSELGLTEQTTLFTDLEDPRLQEQLSRAELVVDYRQTSEQDFLYRMFPIWQLGTPTSAPLPPQHPLCRQGLVLSIRPDNVPEDLSRHLNLLEGSAETLRDMGRQAAEYVKTRHDPERYVDALLSMADCAIDQHTPAACRRFAHRMSSHSSWLPAAEQPEMHRQVANFLDRLSTVEPSPKSRRGHLVTRSSDSNSQVSDRIAELNKALQAEKQARSAADARLIELELKVRELTRDLSGDGESVASHSSLDRYYLAFENRFRGSSEEIKKRLEVYGPQLLETAARFPEELCADLGCGRGEWLEILTTRGLKAVGIDTNEAMIQACREQGLEARLEDGLEFVSSQPNDSLALLTGFHIIEHLPTFETLVTLANETLRALMPGGLAIFESPNPENLTVGACSFYLDHTHQKPLHPESTGLLFQSCGFCDVKVLRLVHGRAYEPPFEAPDPESPMSEQLGKVFHLLNNHLLSAPDFAVVGRKPVAGE